MKFKTSIFLILLTLANVAQARYVRMTYEGIRPLGMGGAFLAVSDDENMLFYNPAALAHVRGAHITLIDMSAGADGFGTAGDILSAVTGEGFENLFDYTGKQYMRASFISSFIARYFGFAIYDNLVAFHEIEELNFPEVDVYLANDLAALIAFGIPIGPHFSIGASARLIQRTSIDFLKTPGELLSEVGLDQTSFLENAFSTIEDDVTLGWGVGVNMSAMIHIPGGRKYPDFTVVAGIEDALDTKFRNIQGVPNSVKMSYHIGTSIRYKLTRKSDLKLAVDMRHLFDRNPWNKMLRAGVELKIPGFSFRAGAYQGYLSAGFGWHLLPHTRVNLATYAVELGEGLWERSQRRWEAQVIIGFNPF